MNKLILGLFSIAVTTTAVAQNCKITGNVPAVPDGASVDLGRMSGNVATIVSSDTVRNGLFTLQTEIDSGLNVFRVRIDAKGISRISRVLYLKPGAEVSVTGNDPFVETYQVISNIPEQAEYDQFLNHSKDLIDSLQNEYIQERLALDNAANNDAKAAIRASFEQNQARRDSLYAAIWLRDIDLLRSLPVTPVWLDVAGEIASRYSSNNIAKGSVRDSLCDVYNELPDSVKQLPAGKSMARHLYPPKTLEIGDSLPNVTFFDLEGVPHKLNEFEGKTLLLVFYSGGCGGCIYHFPDFDKFTENYSKYVEVIKLSIDTEHIWKETTHLHNIQGINWNEGTQMDGLYMDMGARILPFCVLVSPEGKILEKWGSLPTTQQILPKYFDK